MFLGDPSVGMMGSKGGWSLVGSPLNISNIIALTMLTPTRAVVYSSSGTLQAYDFNGVTWSSVGSPLSLGASVYWKSGLTALSSSRIAVIPDNTGILRAYDFNGSSWAAVGSGYTFSGAGSFAIDAVTSSRIFVLDGSATRKIAMDFNGSAWSAGGAQVGGVGGQYSITHLSSGRTVYSGSSYNYYAADYNGSLWSIVGNAYAPAGFPSISAVASIDSTKIALADFDVSPASLTALSFDGSDFSDVGPSYDLTGLTGNRAFLCSPNGNRFLFSNGAFIQAFDYN